MPLAVAKATGVYPATFRERIVPAEKPQTHFFLCCAPGRSQGRSGAVRWSGGLSRRPNGSRTVRPPSRWRVPQTANPGRLPCQGPPYLAVARQRPQTDTDISNKRVLGLLKTPLFGHFPGIASPALGLGCLPRGKSFGARADLFWHGGSGLLALLVRPGRPVFNTLLRHN